MSLVDFEKDEDDLSKFRKEKETDKTKFEIRTIFAFLDAVGAKDSIVNLEERPRVQREFEFNPTIKDPDIVFKDKFDRDFSMWYRPTLYYPHLDSVKEVSPEFAMFEGKLKSMYDVDPELEKILFTSDYFTSNKLKEVSNKLLAKMWRLHTIMFIQPSFKFEDLTRIRNAQFFLKPQRLLLISEKYLPSEVKMNMPVGVEFVENVDMRTTH